MTRYDFDAPIDRHGTDSLKFDNAESRGHSPEALSLWVADMDFATPREAIDALVARSRHGIFGYTEPGDAYFEVLADWMGKRYGLAVRRDDVVITPGVVFALAACVRAFTDPGDAVIIQKPVYYPFASVVELNGRTVANAPLAYRDGAYGIDFDAFEHTVKSSGAKLFLLCNPHNPAGRAWTRGELERLGEICLRHGVLVVSDEIHMDFARPGFSHIPFATVDPELADISITCTSASKTFNLAGLQVANAVVPNKRLRRALIAEIFAEGYSQPNTLGLVATQAAYEHGGDWLAQLKDYLEDNWDMLARRLAAGAPSLHLVAAESTYLAWIDCQSLGMDPEALERFIEDEAGLWLDCGHIFGSEGAGFIRINIATQRAYLERAVGQLTDAVSRITRERT